MYPIPEKNKTAFQTAWLARAAMAILSQTIWSQPFSGGGGKGVERH
jgi:hypothetical protein